MPASFLATPVFDPRNKLIGVMAIEMPIAPINQMMQDNANLGQTSRRGHSNPERQSHDRRNQLEELSISLHIHL